VEAEMKITGITAAQLKRGGLAFERNEGRNSMYRVATFLLKEWWGRHDEMTDALAVLLLTWNGAFYRYGLFDHARLEACLREHWPLIQGFHDREIGSLTDGDGASIRKLFSGLLSALAIGSGKSQGRRSPVAVAKTLHLLAPAFFPLWDDAIARAYDCHYAESPVEAYLRFCRLTKDVATSLAGVASSSKTLLKQIDEYNYARFTQEWI
jgi:hypothetical protein